eukprot:Sspe_Gene.29749::Locus_14310_Transcript_1_1_Confidence_1.000_Length_1670::g.29749::m.29749
MPRGVSVAHPTKVARAPLRRRATMPAIPKQRRHRSGRRKSLNQEIHEADTWFSEMLTSALPPPAPNPLPLPPPAPLPLPVLESSADFQTCDDDAYDGLFPAPPTPPALPSPPPRRKFSRCRGLPVHTPPAMALLMSYSRLGPQWLPLDVVLLVLRCFLHHKSHSPWTMSLFNIDPTSCDLEDALEAFGSTPLLYLQTPPPIPPAFSDKQTRLLELLVQRRDYIATTLNEVYSREYTDRPQEWADVVHFMTHAVEKHLWAMIRSALDKAQHRRLITVPVFLGGRTPTINIRELSRSVDSALAALEATVCSVDDLTTLARYLPSEGQSAFAGVHKALPKARCFLHGVKARLMRAKADGLVGLCAVQKWGEAWLSVSAAEQRVLATAREVVDGVAMTARGVGRPTTCALKKLEVALPEYLRSARDLLTSLETDLPTVSIAVDTSSLRETLSARLCGTIAALQLAPQTCSEDMATLTSPSPLAVDVVVSLMSLLDKAGIGVPPPLLLPLKDHPHTP